MQQLTAVWFLKYFILFQKKKKRRKKVINHKSLKFPVKEEEQGKNGFF